ncbi:hypothetical protein [Roseomonas sp. USHLN139]|uniref:hypothetical protein n=1 Tax=Roseomonas sp. USHLN139 TaxID=3081298 RepID=UPI003B01A27C
MPRPARSRLTPAALPPARLALAALLALASGEAAAQAGAQISPPVPLQAPAPRPAPAPPAAPPPPSAPVPRSVMPQDLEEYARRLPDSLLRMERLHRQAPEGGEALSAIYSGPTGRALVRVGRLPGPPAADGVTERSRAEALVAMAEDLREGTRALGSRYYTAPLTTHSLSVRNGPVLTCGQLERRANEERVTPEQPRLMNRRCVTVANGFLVSVYVSTPFKTETEALANRAQIAFIAGMADRLVRGAAPGAGGPAAPPAGGGTTQPFGPAAREPGPGGQAAPPPAAPPAPGREPPTPQRPAPVSPIQPAPGLPPAPATPDSGAGREPPTPQRPAPVSPIRPAPEGAPSPGPTPGPRPLPSPGTPPSGSIGGGAGPGMPMVPRAPRPGVEKGGSEI